MPKLPRISGKEVIKILTKIGFVAVRQKGSHVILRKEGIGGSLVTVVPQHSEIDRGTLLEIIRQAGLSREEFFKLY